MAEQNAWISVGAARFLRAELVAGKADDREVLARELLVQALEVRVLRREAAAARDVHREHDLALQPGEQVPAAVEPVHLEVVEVLHPRILKGDAHL